MSEAHEVDVVLIGVGPAGEDLALQPLDAGPDVVGIESQLLVGALSVGPRGGEVLSMLDPETEPLLEP